MKKLFALAFSAVALFMMSATFKSDTNIIEEAELSEARYTSVYEGKVSIIGSCTFGLEICGTTSTSTLLFSKSGVSPVSGNWYRVTSNDQITSCGRNATTLTQISPCDPR